MDIKINRNIIATITAIDCYNSLVIKIMIQGTQEQEKVKISDLVILNSFDNFSTIFQVCFISRKRSIPYKYG